MKTFSKSRRKNPLPRPSEPNLYARYAYHKPSNAKSKDQTKSRFTSRVGSRSRISKETTEQPRAPPGSLTPEELENQQRLGPVVYPQIPVLGARQKSLPRQRGFRFRCFPTTLLGQLLFGLVFVCLVWYRVQVGIVEYCRPNEIAKSK